MNDAQSDGAKNTSEGAMPPFALVLMGVYGKYCLSLSSKHISYLHLKRNQYYRKYWFLYVGRTAIKHQSTHFL